MSTSRQGKLGREFADGEHIVEQGQMMDCLYVVQSGEVDVVHVDAAGEQILGQLGPGDTFGLHSLFNGEPIPHAMRARGTTRVLHVDKKLFLQRISEDPSLAFEIIRELLDRLQRAGTRTGSLRVKGL